MSQLSLKDIITLLREFTVEVKSPLEIILVGGLAMHHYGMKDRATIDIDAEVKGDLEGLFRFLKSRKIPSDLGEDISGWSVVAMPENYRDRAETVYRDHLLVVKVLHPLDFVIAKLRRFTDEDLEDALFVVKCFGIKVKEIETAAHSAVKNSPKDTALFIFDRQVKYFLKVMKEQG